MNFFFFCSDLHIPKHVERYIQVFPSISSNHRLQYTYFPFPIFVHLVADNSEYSNFLLSKLSSLDELKSLHQRDSPLQNLHSKNFSLIDPFDFIEDTSFTWRGLRIFDYVKRDMSLCLKSRISELSLCSDSLHMAFIRLTFISSCLSIEIAHNLFSNFNQNPPCIDRCIIPDAYSAYNAVAGVADTFRIKSMILTADGHFNDLLKILPRDIQPVNLAAHNAQQLAYEYTTPDVFFSLAKLYLEEKVIKGLSTQAYSSAHSDLPEQKRVFDFLHKYPNSLAYFTSSPDEQSESEYQYDSYSIQSGQLSKGIDLFSDEYALLTDLIEYSLRSDYGLIIRMHPRLGSERRSTQISSARQHFLSQVNSLDQSAKDRILLIEPEAKLSSYWLGAHSAVNIFYRSSIGSELSMLGFPSISPQHLNSYTYQGNYYETATAASTIVGWHNQIDLVVNKEFSYYIHLAVRGFYIQRFSSTFRVDPSNNSILTSLNSNNGPIASFDTTDRNDISDFFTSCSSFSLPRIKGYWSLQDYMSPWKSYMHWLLNSAYPQLDISRKLAVRLARIQSQQFHQALFDSRGV